MEKNNTPSIRFKGFTDPWEQRKFIELVERRSRYSDDPKLPRVEYEDIVSGLGMLNKDVNKKQDDRGGIAFEVDDVLYGKLRPYLRNWLNPQFKGIALGDFWVLDPAGIDSKFLFSLIRTPAFERIANEATGTKMPRADWQNVSNAEFAIPVTVEEQSCIGSFFRKLDDLITLHQRKLKMVKDFKNSMLEKMFPKNGSDVPEIRFAGFSDPWEQRKLGEVAEFSKGVGYSKSDIKNSGTPLIHYGRLYTNYELGITSVDTFADEQPGSYVSNGHEVITPSSGETAEDIAVASAVFSPGILLGGGLNVVLPGTQLDPLFLAMSISNGEQHRELTGKAQGKSVVHLYNDDLAKSRITMPALSEQEKIGTFFRKLDDLITLHQRKLDKLKDLKKSMLEKMFA